MLDNVRKQLWVWNSSSSNLMFDAKSTTHATLHDSLSKTTLLGTLEGGRRGGRQRKCWMDKIREWISLPVPKLLTRASCRKDWKKDLCLVVPPVPPTTKSVKELN